MRAFRGSDCGRDPVRTGERHWESRPKRVRAPYPKSEPARQDPEYHGTRETLCLQAVEHLYMVNRVLFVERSGELRMLARLSTLGAEPKGNQVLIGL